MQNISGSSHMPAGNPAYNRRGAAAAATEGGRAAGGRVAKVELVPGGVVGSMDPTGQNPVPRAQPRTSGAGVGGWRGGGGAAARPSPGGGVRGVMLVDPSEEAAAARRPREAPSAAAAAHSLLKAALGSAPPSPGRDTAAPGAVPRGESFLDTPAAQVILGCPLRLFPCFPRLNAIPALNLTVFPTGSAILLSE